MTITFSALLFNPLYEHFGIDGILQTASNVYELRILDQTAGVAVDWPEGNGSLQTLRPAASVRASELDQNGITKEALRGAILSINGRDWRVHAVQERPTHHGASDGEVLMFLEAA